jgi:hypothetical protein
MYKVSQGTEWPAIVMQVRVRAAVSHLNVVVSGKVSHTLEPSVLSKA